MAKRSDEAGVLPPRAVPGTPKAIDTPIWLALHNNVALKLLQCLYTNFQRMLIQTTGFRVMILGAGWQAADHTAESFEQPLSQRSRLRVQRQPIQSPFGQLGCF